MAWLSFQRSLTLAPLVLAVACGSDPDAVGTGNGPVNVGDGGAPFSDAGTPWDSGISAQNDSGVVVIPGGDGGCGSVRAMTQPSRGEVDVLWVVDDSGSMIFHMPGVVQNMGRFMQNVRMTGAGLEVVMLTGPAIGTLLQGSITDPNYHWVAAPVDSHNSFPITMSTYNDWSKFLRPGAPLHVIFVTDDAADILWNGNRFVTEFRARLAGRPFTIHAVATQRPGGPALCPSFGPGTEYYTAARATQGSEFDLCGDWGANFDKLQADVIASVPLPCEYTIPPVPTGETLNPGAVQVVYTPSGGKDEEFAKASTPDKCAGNRAWHFDNESAPTKVVMCPTACDAVKAGGGISIGFGCAPTVVLN